MLKKYTQRAVNVLACEIHKDGKIEEMLDDKGKARSNMYVYTYRGRSAITTRLEFSVGVKQKPKSGDFIIQEDKNRCHLEKREEFSDDYVVAGMSIM